MRLIDAERLKLILRNSEYMDAFVDENGNTLYSDHLLVGAGYDDVCKAIDEQPTVEPERKKGKWIRNDNGTYSCNLCHSWIPEEQYYYAQFCLYCGADMKSSEPEIEQCCNNCRWYRSMDDYCVSCSCNIDGREKHSCFEEK